jgi:two-component system sensor histidine kinase AtoS
MRPLEPTNRIILSVPPRLHAPVLWIVAAMVSAITLLHYLTDVQLVPYHLVYRSLYYIPIAIAAVRWGLWGGLSTAGIICILYIPHTLIALHASMNGIDVLLECGAFLFVAGLTGYLADAERRQRLRAQQAAAQQQAQAEAAERMRAFVTSILESIDSGVLTVDPTGKVMTLNPAVRTLLDIDAPNDLALPAVLHEYLHAGAQGYQQVTYAGRTLGLHGTPLRGAQGEQVGTVLVLDDLTERRAMEVQMQRTERLVALGRLAGGLAHELRNPLGITRAAAQMLQQELADDGKPGEYTRVIQSEIDRVDRLVEQLLAYARPRPLQRSLVNVAALVEETSGLAWVYAKQQEVTLTTQVSDDLPLLMGDGDLLHQAVVNVLLNGIQATSPGGTVNLTAQTEYASVLLTVCDTGQGIAPEILPHIFDPFFTTRDDGTGLGLSIVQQIVHDHGGTVEIQSTPGQGTQVRLRLPLVPGACPEPVSAEGVTP